MGGDGKITKAVLVITPAIANLVLGVLSITVPAHLQVQAVRPVPVAQVARPVRAARRQVQVVLPPALRVRQILTPVRKMERRAKYCP